MQKKDGGRTEINVTAIEITNIITAMSYQIKNKK